MEIWKTNESSESGYENTETTDKEINIYAHTLHNLIAINKNSHNFK